MENNQNNNVIGTCPHCGGNIMFGKFGAYCEKRCGFFCNKALGVELSKENVISLLGGKEIYLENILSKRTGNPYNAYIKPTGVSSFSYFGKDGSEKAGYSFAFEMRFDDSSPKN